MLSVSALLEVKSLLSPLPGDETTPEKAVIEYREKRSSIITSTGLDKPLK
jgi:hypothetical protein